ncbi:acyl carrier protein [Mesorhizobium sp.]|uniref:acyl carrier protein n=1 Tax=Mesorhizobium sp. TaxID=1871066 RepID=UPI0025FB481B|nr:acyl carrier protein [Mesorhizobium sp.]
MKMVPTTDDRRSREGDLIAVVREFVHELQPQRANAIDISPSSRIERDLGIDSLGRTELILRIERAFRVRLPTQIVGEADTIGDLINALEHAPDRARSARYSRPLPFLPFRLPPRPGRSSRSSTGTSRSILIACT